MSDSTATGGVTSEANDDTQLGELTLVEQFELCDDANLIAFVQSVLHIVADNIKNMGAELYPELDTLRQVLTNAVTNDPNISHEAAEAARQAITAGIEHVDRVTQTLSTLAAATTQIAITLNDISNMYHNRG